MVGVLILVVAVTLWIGLCMCLPPSMLVVGRLYGTKDGMHDVLWSRRKPWSVRHRRWGRGSRSAVLDGALMHIQKRPVAGQLKSRYLQLVDGSLPCFYGNPYSRFPACTDSMACAVMLLHENTGSSLRFRASTEKRVRASSALWSS